MKWLFLLIAYLPIVSILGGLTLLVAGFVLRKTKKQISKSLFITSGVCIGIFILIYGAFFLIGALGIGPILN